MGVDKDFPALSSHSWIFLADLKRTCECWWLHVTPISHYLIAYNRTIELNIIRSYSVIIYALWIIFRNILVNLGAGEGLNWRISAWALLWSISSGLRQSQAGPRLEDYRFATRFASHVGIYYNYICSKYNDAQRSQKSKYSGICVTCIFDSLTYTRKLF